MTEFEVSEISRQIVEGAILNNWKFYAVGFLVFAISGFVGALLASYAKVRGASLATKADFQDLLSQVRETTRVTESIKREVSHEDWVKRENKILLRQKIEDLLRSVYEVESWLAKQHDYALYGADKNDEVDPTYKIEVIGWLYFPELQDELRNFKLAVLDYKQWLNDCHTKTGPPLMLHDAEAYGQALDAAQAGYRDVYQPILDSTAVIERRSREIMQGVLSRGQDSRDR